MLMRKPLQGLNRQRGIGMFMLVFVFVVCALVLMLGLKLFPVYSQYFNIKSVFRAMAKSEEVRTGTVADIRKSFERRATIGYVEVITKEDLEITKEGGETVVSVAWQEKIPLFTGYTLVVDLSASTADK